MKTLVAAVVLVFAPAAYAQESEDSDFKMSGEIKYRYLFSDVPTTIQLDYTDRADNPQQELGVMLHLKLFKNLTVDGYPYFWNSDSEAGISRIGLWLQAQYEVIDGWLKVGYAHHSWHNVDEESPGLHGRSQDSVFLDLNFWEPCVGGKENGLKMEFHFQPRYYFNNSSPIEIRNVYEEDYPTAWGEAAFPIMARYWRLEALIKPYAQFNLNEYRLGVSGELDCSITRWFSIFTDFDYSTIDGESQYMIGIGVKLKFR